MKLRTTLMACAAMAAAMVPAAHAAQRNADGSITISQDELDAIINRKVEDAVDRATRGRAAPASAPAPAPNMQNLEQRVQDLEISQGAKINALQTRADAVQLSFENTRPVITTGDGRFELALRARFHFDAATYDQEPGPNVPFALDGGNPRDLNSGSYFRRVQFGVEGKFFRDFDYEIRLNFGGSENENSSSGNQNVNIMRVAYNPTPEIRINVGAIQPTFTLDDSTSSNDITFLERASVVNAVLGPFGGSDGRRGVELTYLKQGEKFDWMINAAYTTNTTGTRDPADDRDQVLGRLAARVFKNDDWDVHLGANTAFILSAGGQDITNNNQNPVRNRSFSDRPELRVANESLINTGNIPTESGWLWGVEGGVRYKNFYVSGEYFQWGIERDRTCTGCNVLAPDPEFSGWYVMASWILTGETKRYETQNRSNSRMQFGAPRPNSPFSTGGTWGAWELAARYSTIDLNFNVNPLNLAVVGPLNSNFGEYRGGEQSIVTVNLNWYLNRNMRIMFAYQHVDVDRLSSVALTSAGASPTNPPGVTTPFPNIGQEYNAFSVRTQFAF